MSPARLRFRDFLSELGVRVGDVVRDMGLRRRRVQNGPSRFTMGKRQRFLDALALTCNVGRSADHAGINKSTAYKLRAVDADFAARWQDAVETAYDRLELMVLEHGGGGAPLDEADGERAAREGVTQEFDFDKALSILRYYRARRDGQPNTRTGRPPKTVTPEETNAALLKALGAVKKRLEAERDRGA